MKNLLSLLFCSMVLFSCMNHPDFDEYSQRQTNDNVKNVFGVEFPSSQDWHTTSTHDITIVANDNNIVKALILVSTVNKDNSISMTILNEICFESKQEVNLIYDLPDAYDHLYIAFVDKDNQYFYKTFNIAQHTVYFKDNTASARKLTRAASQLPDVPTLNTDPIQSYANIRGWVNDWLYSYDYYTFNVEDYDDEYKAIMNDVIFNYLPNGRKYNNTPQIYRSGYYNETSYLITTGESPIMISPVYKNDGGYQEITFGELYYYYYDANNDLSVSELEVLPKYRAVVLSDLFTNDVNNIFKKSKSYALVFWGDDTHEPSYIFPANYKIGFMYRSTTTADNKKKQGEIYLDGRLNTHINGWGNFKTSKLNDTDPRMGYAKVNDKTFICVESGTDADFNDLIVELEGGYQPLTIIRDEHEYQFYTFCYEDSKLGDYDMNDVVLKGRRLNSTQVEYTLMACGANDNLYIYNIDGKTIKSDKEVHALFGRSASQFVNTTAGDNVPYIVDTITVSDKFSFLDATTQPYIFDKTKNWEVHISRRGEDPHAIMIPYDFAWPLERICIKDAYLQFNNWGLGSIEDTDWYKYSEEGKVFE